MYFLKFSVLLAVAAAAENCGTGPQSGVKDDDTSVKTCDAGTVVTKCTLRKRSPSAKLPTKGSDGVKISDDGTTCTAFKGRGGGKPVEALVQCKDNPKFTMTKGCPKVPRFIHLHREMKSKQLKLTCPVGYNANMCTYHSAWMHEWTATKEEILADGTVTIVDGACETVCPKKCSISLVCELAGATYVQLLLSRAHNSESLPSFCEFIVLI